MIIHLCFGAQSLFSISSNKLFNSTLHCLKTTKRKNFKPNEVQRLGRYPDVVNVILSVSLRMGETEREEKIVFMKYKADKDSITQERRSSKQHCPTISSPLDWSCTFVLLGSHISILNRSFNMFITLKLHTIIKTDVFY